jgi:putative hydrolase of the HAD superfamily
MRLQVTGGSRGRPVPAVIFDGDDTLWVTQFLYDQAAEEVRLIIASAGLDPKVWDEVCNQHDIGNVSRFGFSSHRYPTSVVAAYAELAERSAVGIDPRLVKQLHAAASSVFRRRAPLVAGVRGVLEELGPEARIILLTKGDPMVQRKRILDSGLTSLLDAIAVVDDKSEATFRELTARLGLDPSRTWSVGNSLPSDVNTAVRAGMHGIWVDANSWSYERREKQPAPGVVQLARLTDVPGHVLQALRGPEPPQTGLAA